MGRKLKKGFDYFTLDTSFSDSVRLSALEIGGHGLSLLIELWQIIYGKHGYYMDFSDDCKILFLHSSVTKIDLIELDRCLNVFFKRGVFSKDIYDKYKVLTSDSIQERYIETCIISKRVNNCMFEEYLLINKKDFETKNFEFKNLFGINTEEIQIYSEEIGINTEESTQSKLNEIKLNETIENTINNKSNQYIYNNTIDEQTKKKIETFERICQKFLIDDLQNFVDHFKELDIREENIKQALQDYKDDKLIGEVKSLPYNYSYFKGWFKTYISENRARYVHVPKMRIVSISESVSREDLHTAFKFYWMDEYTIEEIRERILSGEYKPKDGVPFDNLIKNKLIEVRND